MGSLGTNDVFGDFQHLSSAKRVFTQMALTASIRAHHPDLALTTLNSYFNLIGFAEAGLAKATEDRSSGAYVVQREYCPPSGRFSKSEGTFSNRSYFVKYNYEWEGNSFIIYQADCDKGQGENDCLFFVLHEPEGDETKYDHCVVTDNLIVAVKKWTAEFHDEVWIFDEGYWQRNSKLCQSIQDSDWDDVILDADLKKSLIKDVEGFFDSQETYRRFGVPWKRGIILHGDPGNGKTVSIKAIMKGLTRRKVQIPTLYVKAFKGSNMASQLGISQIFDHARDLSPCLLVLEDLDSLVTDDIRSYFLNEVDGVQSNDGILIIGSTNHLDSLDPAMVRRPSRFDRKYPFRMPVEAQRVQYAQHWMKKVLDISEVTMVEADCAPVAAATEGFTFAYMKEAFMATLFHLFSHQEESQSATGSDGASAFIKSFEKQAAMLKDQMADEEKAEGVKKEAGDDE